MLKNALQLWGAYEKDNLKVLRFYKSRFIFLKPAFISFIFFASKKAALAKTTALQNLFKLR
jgi:hypothetical protein